MNRFKKILKPLLLAFFMLFIISVIVGYIFLTNRWRLAFTSYQMQLFAEEINKSPTLPDSIYEIYDKIEPGQRKLGMNKELLRIIGDIIGVSDKYSKPSYFRRIYSFIFVEKNGSDVGKSKLRYPDYFLAWGLQKYCTSEKAFDYVFQKEYEYFGSRESILNYHKALFKKDLRELSQAEIIEVMLIMESPSQYNKYKYPERFEMKMQELMNLVNTSTEPKKWKNRIEEK